MLINKYFYTFFFLLIFACEFSKGVDLNENHTPLSPRILDSADVLDQKSLTELEIKLNTLLENKHTLVHIVLDPESVGSNIAKYAKQIFHEQNLHQLNKSRTVLIYVSIASHQIHVELGSAMNKRFPANLRDNLIQKILIPHFSHRLYAEGLLQGLMNLNSAEGIKTGPSFQISDLEFFISINLLMSLILMPFFLKLIKTYKREGHLRGMINKNLDRKRMRSLFGLETGSEIAMRLFQLWIGLILILMIAPHLNTLLAICFIILIYMGSIYYFYSSEKSIH